MQRWLSMFLAALILLSLMGCGSALDSSEAKGGFYKVCGVYYPEELGAPMLGEATSELDISTAAEQITNVGDALYFVSILGQSLRSDSLCTLFIDLIIDDYDEVGMIDWSCSDSWENNVGHNSHTIVYVKNREAYYPFDPCCMSDSEILESKKVCVAATDLDLLSTRLKASYPRPNGTPVESKIVSLDKDEYVISGQYAEEQTTLSISGQAIPMRKGLDKDSVREKLLALTAEEYSTDDIQAFVDANLTLEEAAETFTTIQDAINYLRARDFYVDYAQGTGVVYNSVCWVWNPSAEFAFSHNAAHCAGTTNIMNRLLADDYGAQGYVNYVGNPNCHIFNYFCVDGLYFFCDFTGDRNPITRADYNDKNKYCYILYVTDDPMDFGAYYMEDHNDISSSDYIIHLECYEADGEDIVPTGFFDDPSLRQYTKKGDWLMDIFPKNLESKMQMLFIRDGYSVQFSEAPPDELRPSEEHILTDAEYNMKHGEK